MEQGVRQHCMSIRRFQGLLFALIIIAGPMSVTPWSKIILAGLFGVSALQIALLSLSNGGLMISHLSSKIILSYLLIFVVGFLSLLINSTEPYGLLISTETLGRLFSIATLSLTLVACYAHLASLTENEFEQLGKIWLIPGFIFVLFGTYQIYCNLTGKPFFIETRDWMHGVPAIIRDAVPKRVTSIAEEPSFLSPILIETFLLVMFLVKTKWLRYSVASLVAAILLLTFSGGGYVNAIMLGGCATLLLFWRFPLGKPHFFILILLVSFLTALFAFGQILIEFAMNKFIHEASGGSSRAQFMKNLLDIQFNASPFNLLFGHGLTSMSHLNEFGMQMEDMLFRISNNMFLDILWESGLIGIMSVMALFALLLRQSLMIQLALNKRLSLSLLLTIQMLCTGLYRSEYISTHLIWMLILVVWAIGWEKSKIRRNSELSCGDKI